MLWPFDLFEREFGGRAATSGKILCRLLLTCLLVVAVPPAFAQPATEGDQNIRIVAPQFVPLQFSKDGEVRGYVADLAKLVIDRVAGEMALTTTGIEIVPWRRAMKIATESPNVLMFSLSRTKTREDKFIWVGEVSPYEVFFFGLRDRQIEDPGSLDDMHGRGYRVGVLSERDIAHCFAELGSNVVDLRVQDMMSRDVVTCSPTDDVNDAMRVMSQRRIRHLPVVENGALSGMISSRDVMEAMLEQTVLERDVLRDYAIAAR